MNRRGNFRSISDEEVNKLMTELKTYQPTIPDEITKYLLQTSGCSIEDQASIRLISLATQRYITEIISKASDYNKERKSREIVNNENSNKKRDALLLEDLQNALHDMGVDVKKKGLYS